MHLMHAMQYFKHLFHRSYYNPLKCPILEEGLKIAWFYSECDSENYIFTPLLLGNGILVVYIVTIITHLL